MLMEGLSRAGKLLCVFPYISCLPPSMLLEDIFFVPSVWLSEHVRGTVSLGVHLSFTVHSKVVHITVLWAHNRQDPFIL